MTQSPLIEKMRAVADMVGIRPADAERLRTLATALEDAITNIGQEDGAKRMLGAYARARIAYADITGTHVMDPL